jgi:hypothetical protein
MDMYHDGKSFYAIVEEWRFIYAISSLFINIKMCLHFIIMIKFQLAYIEDIKFPWIHLYLPIVTSLRPGDAINSDFVTVG